MTFKQTLGIQYPIVQAPMAGVTTPDFVAAGTETGILGSIGAGYLTATETRTIIQQVKALTNGPFSVNLFVPDNTPFDQEQLRLAYEALQPIGEQLGMPFWKAPLSEPDFHGQIDVVIEEKPAACSFTFGIPDVESIERLHDAGILLIGTATTLDEAMAVQQAGLDMVVIQGAEAGGHRGSFHPDGPLIPLNNLLAEVRDVIQLPIIAAGGVATNARMTELMNNGASAVQIGTALLATEESGASIAYKQAVLSASLDDTVITEVFSGRPARGIRNRFIDQMNRSPIAPYPYQNDLTKRIRKEAAMQNNADFLSLWAGTGVQNTQAGTVESIVSRLLNKE
ncbi:NAD(P)H-dependent flavin oxidoreductase [Sporosarcina gallistercoris]|uniref:Probable nitronate monooxygenase n=1 Tax=Sporosarcina gallistercoris TaxID=2762245 RepID=A0ABR8PH18_9BACL|nr:nitronate monooxygenase [Sporosarcina gallistercoris]MBD7907465.1 nitronate monooxygenase [Sporosarcina gallistercoris]